MIPEFNNPFRLVAICDPTGREVTLEISPLNETRGEVRRTTAISDLKMNLLKLGISSTAAVGIVRQLLKGQDCIINVSLNKRDLARWRELRRSR
jgi:hypothetical protein